jgi:hypothetical protein
MPYFSHLFLNLEFLRPKQRSLTASRSPGTTSKAGTRLCGHLPSGAKPGGQMTKSRPQAVQPLSRLCPSKKSTTEIARFTLLSFHFSFSILIPLYR